MATSVCWMSIGITLTGPVGAVGHLHGLLERGQGGLGAAHAKAALDTASSMVSWSGASWM
jgi:hypothetical protein